MNDWTSRIHGELEHVSIIGMEWTWEPGTW